MQVATVPVQICTDTVACAYNFLTIFSLSSLYLTLSSLSLSGAQLFLSSSHLINLSSFSFRRLPLLLLPPPLIALSSFVSCCFRVEWAWSVGFGLNVSRHCHRHRHRHRLPLEASILFLVLTITTGGVDLVAQGEASIPVWVLIHFAGFFFLVFCRWVVWIPVWYRCGLWVWVLIHFARFFFSDFLPVGCVDSSVIPVWIVGVGRWLWVGGCVCKEINILFE